MPETEPMAPPKQASRISIISGRYHRLRTKTLKTEQFVRNVDRDGPKCPRIVEPPLRDHPGFNHTSLNVWPVLKRSAKAPRAKNASRFTIISVCPIELGPLGTRGTFEASGDDSNDDVQPEAFDPPYRLPHSTKPFYSSHITISLGWTSLPNNQRSEPESGVKPTETPRRTGKPHLVTGSRYPSGARSRAVPPCAIP